MKLSPLFVIFSLLLVTVSAAEVTSESGVPLGAENTFGQNLASSAVVGNQLQTQIQTLLTAVVQFVVLVTTVVTVVFLVWVILMLVVLRNIMKRDDLTDGEKVGWVLIVFGVGFIPFSIFGLLLYALASGKKKPVAK